MKKKLIVGLSIVGIIGLLIIIKKEDKTLLVKDENINNLSNTKLAVNISEDGINYEIANDIPESGYTINEEKSVCKVQTETSGIENALIDRSISIEYKEGKINFLGIGKRATRCYLYFDKYVEPTSEATLAKLNINPSYIKSGDPDFTKTATGAETVADNGIYKTSDPMYGENAETYYWRGAATSNHVIFANKCWRIVRINGDGTIRLIYNGTPSGDSPNQTCPGNGSNVGSIAVTSQKYNSDDIRSEYVGYTYTEGSQRPENNETGISSNLKMQTDTWYNNNIENNIVYKDKVADGKYCNDRNVALGYTWTSTGSKFRYAAYERLVDKKTPTLSCETNDIYILKVGAITADEVSMAGGVYNTSNSSYYLYGGQEYWTMSPYIWENTYACVFIMHIMSSLNNSRMSDGTIGIRPVINLRSDVTFNAGSDGTQNNPFVVEGA